jgi:hypothetical protein
MNLPDYEKLSRLRLTNYLTIIKMLLKTDQRPETYQECRKKVFQVQALIKYLNLKGHETLLEALRDNKPFTHEDDDKKDAEKEAEKKKKEAEKEKQDEDE